MDFACIKGFDIMLTRKLMRSLNLKIMKKQNVQGTRFESTIGPASNIVIIILLKINAFYDS